jgi:hypothetical protein
MDAEKAEVVGAVQYRDGDILPGLTYHSGPTLAWPRVSCLTPGGRVAVRDGDWIVALPEGGHTVLPREREADPGFRPGDAPPAGYLAWHSWAAVQQQAGLRQRRCHRCRLYFFPQELDTAATEDTGEPICRECGHSSCLTHSLRLSPPE